MLLIHGAHAQGGLRSWVVCVLVNIAPLEPLFVLKTLSYTQQATKVKLLAGISLKSLRCRHPVLPALYRYPFSTVHFALCRTTRMDCAIYYTHYCAYNIICNTQRVCTVVLFIPSCTSLLCQGECLSSMPTKYNNIYVATIIAQMVMTTSYLKLHNNIIIIIIVFRT